MTNRLIDQFPAAGPLAGGELLLGWQSGATVTVTPDQIVALVPAVPAAPTVSATSNYTITAADNGTLYDNNGAVGPVTFLLPAASEAGLGYGFAVVEDEAVSIAANGSDGIAVGGQLLTGVLSAATSYASVALRTSNQAGTWIVTAITGEWS